MAKTSYYNFTVPTYSNNYNYTSCQFYCDRRKGEVEKLKAAERGCAAQKLEDHFPGYCSVQQGPLPV